MTERRTPPPKPQQHPAPPPSHVLGEAIPLNLLMARSDTAAVQIRHMTAYPNGFEFELVAHFVETPGGWDPLKGLGGLRARPGDRRQPLSDEHLRVRILFADGSEANNFGPPLREPGTSGPFLQPRDTRARASVAQVIYWVSPLPPPGPLTFVFEWPEHGIPPTRHEIDALLISEAATRATELWPDLDLQSS